MKYYTAKSLLDYKVCRSVGCQSNFDYLGVLECAAESKHASIFAFWPWS